MVNLSTDVVFIQLHFSGEDLKDKSNTWNNTTTVVTVIAVVIIIAFSLGIVLCKCHNKRQLRRDTSEPIDQDTVLMSRAT